MRLARTMDVKRCRCVHQSRVWRLKAIKVWKCGRFHYHCTEYHWYYSWRASAGIPLYNIMWVVNYRTRDGWPWYEAYSLGHTVYLQTGNKEGNLSRRLVLYKSPWLLSEEGPPDYCDVTLQCVLETDRIPYRLPSRCRCHLQWVKLRARYRAQRAR